jgi:hypothetical protein
MQYFKKVRGPIVRVTRMTVFLGIFLLLELFRGLPWISSRYYIVQLVVFMKLSQKLVSAYSPSSPMSMILSLSICPCPCSCTCQCPYRCPCPCPCRCPCPCPCRCRPCPIIFCTSPLTHFSPRILATRSFSTMGW